MHIEDPYVKHEVEAVEGKNAKAVEGKRRVKLKALLSEDPKAKFATPVVTKESGDA